MALLETKLFEVRDRGTCMVCIGLRFSGVETERETKMLARCGFGANAPDHGWYVLFGDADGGQWALTSDPYEQGSTLREAHWFVRENWDILPSGSMIDVEAIRENRNTVKQSEFD